MAITGHYCETWHSWDSSHKTRAAWVGLTVLERYVVVLEQFSCSAAAGVEVPTWFSWVSHVHGGF